MRFFHRLALKLEAVAQAIKGQGSGPAAIEAHAGYATQENLIVQGRVLAKRDLRDGLVGGGRWRNFRTMLSKFATDELQGVLVVANGVEAVSDEEGYFSLVLPRPAKYGWVDIPVCIPSSAAVTNCPAFVPHPDANYLMISDIDDTVMETGAHSLLRNLWTTFTGDAHGRKIYDDAVGLISELSAGERNPIFYVSSSPWNLYGFLNEVFDHNKLTKGPMFLRDYGLSETKFVTDGHGDHKGGSIDVILRSVPDLPVILLGDTGQKDAEIHANVAETHKSRIACVILREAKDGVDDRDAAFMRRLRDHGVPVICDTVFPSSQTVLKVIQETINDPKEASD